MEKKTKRRIFDNILWLYLETIVMVILGQLLGVFLLGGMTLLLSAFIPNLNEMPEWVTGASYAMFIGIWIVGLLWIGLSKKDRGILKTLWTAPQGNRISYFLLGIVIGAGLNGVCILVAYLNKDIVLFYDAFHPLSFVIIFVCVLIQSAAEEFLCRGFLYQRLRRSYKHPAVAIFGSSLLFAILHLGNEGVTALSIVNITLVGILFALMVYYMDSMWCVFAVHTAWNFTQNIVFGLPNSGIVVPYSVWKLDAASARDSFAYNVGFGIEGTVISDIVLLAACVAMYLWGQKFGKQPYNVWEEKETIQTGKMESL